MSAAGTILPLGPVVQHTNEIDGEEFTLYLYLAENGEASYQLHEEDKFDRCAPLWKETQCILIWIQSRFEYIARFLVNTTS